MSGIFHLIEVQKENDNFFSMKNAFLPLLQIPGDSVSQFSHRGLPRVSWRVSMGQRRLKFD